MNGSLEERYEYVSDFVLQNGDGDILLSDRYINKKYPLDFICFICGEKYSVSWDSFREGARCIKCTIIKVHKKQKKNIDDIRKYVEENGDGDFLISNEYISKKTPMEFYCHQHNGVYRISWDDFNSGGRCQPCSKKSSAKKRSKLFSLVNGNLKENFPEISKEWDYILNEDVPENFPCFSNYLCHWICSNCGKKYDLKICVRTKRGTSCPFCSRIRANISKGNSKIESWLIEGGFDFEKEKRFSDCKDKRSLPFDFCVKLTDSIILIEFQGRQHYQPIDFSNKSDDTNRDRLFKINKNHDAIKKRYCEDNNICFIEIPYWDFDEIDKILENNLLSSKGR